MNWAHYHKFWLAAVPALIGLIDELWIHQGEPWVAAAMFVLGPLLVLIGPANR